jgi:hypothetical protein
MLVAGAALADAYGEPTLALYSLLVAVPALAAAGLSAFGEVLDGESGAACQLQALLWLGALALVVVGTAVRAPAVRDDVLPPLGASALVACLVVLALEALLGAGSAAVERAPRQLPETVPEELREAA